MKKKLTNSRFNYVSELFKFDLLILSLSKVLKPISNILLKWNKNKLCMGFFLIEVTKNFLLFAITKYFKIMKHID